MPGGKHARFLGRYRIRPWQGARDRESGAAAAAWGAEKATKDSDHLNLTESETAVDTRRQFVLKVSLLIGSSLFYRVPALAMERNHPAHFLAEERRIIEEFYHRAGRGRSKGLPPGLAKRGGNLPPGLQKHLQKNGQLPPGLQKRLEPLPVDLDRRLPPLPDYWERVVTERDVILIDRRTNRILDIIENVIDLATGR